MKRILFFIVLFMSFTVSFAKDKEVELTVQGQGNTKEEAVVNALQNALAQVNGTFMSSNSTITNDDLVALSFDELGTSADVCIAVAKGDPKGLLPIINEAIAKMTEENKIEEFKETASDYADVWQEVSAPEEDAEGEE